MEPEPTPYLPAQKKEWITCEEPGMEGLAIYVRTGITNAEKADLVVRHDAIYGAYTDQWNATPPEERDMADSPFMRERALLAPYIHDWNVIGLTNDDSTQNVPPPAVAGADAFDLIGPDEYQWIARVVLIGYAITGKAVAWPSRPASSGSGSEKTSDEPDPPPDPKSRPSRRKS